MDYSNYIRLSDVEIIKPNTAFAVSSLELGETMCVKFVSNKIDAKTANTIDYESLYELCMRTWFFDKKYPTNEDFTRVWTDGPDKCAYFIPENSETGIALCVEEFFDEKLGRTRLALSQIRVLDKDWSRYRKEHPLKKYKEME